MPSSTTSARLWNFLSSANGSASIAALYMCIAALERLTMIDESSCGAACPMGPRISKGQLAKRGSRPGVLLRSPRSTRARLTLAGLGALRHCEGRRPGQCEARARPSLLCTRKARNGRSVMTGLVESTTSDGQSERGDGQYPPVPARPRGGRLAAIDGRRGIAWLSCGLVGGAAIVWFILLGPGEMGPKAEWFFGAVVLCAVMVL